MGWAAGRLVGTEGHDLESSPHPWVLQPSHTPLRSSTSSPDRTGITVPRAAAREGSTEGVGEGLQGLYSSQDKQAWYRGAGQGGQGARRRGRRCPSCDLARGSRRTGQGQARGFARSTSGFAPGRALACGEDRGRGCAGAGAEPATSTPQKDFPCCLR